MRERTVQTETAIGTEREWHSENKTETEKNESNKTARVEYSR